MAPGAHRGRQEGAEGLLALVGAGIGGQLAPEGCQARQRRTEGQAQHLPFLLPAGLSGYAASGRPGAAGEG